VITVRIADQRSAGIAAPSSYACSIHAMRNDLSEARTTLVTSAVTARWIEHAYEEGAAMPPERWSAILTVITQRPRTEERLRKNPLGIYVDAIAWSRELGGNG